MHSSYKVIKLNAIDSTNNYLKSLSRKVDLQAGVVVVAHEQTQGRGQRNAKWHSEAGKSLIFSILYRFESLRVTHQFAINCAVALGIVKGLERLGISGLAIKWPNDILAGGKKLCGILIENQLKGAAISSSVIGIGMNVNNQLLPGLPQATSLAIHSGKEFDLDAVLRLLLDEVYSELNGLDGHDPGQLKVRYERKLFRIDKVSAFENPKGEQWNAIIRGISEEGALGLELEDASVHYFKLKEVKLLY